MPHNGSASDPLLVIWRSCRQEEPNDKLEKGSSSRQFSEMLVLIMSANQVGPILAIFLINDV